MAKKISKLWDRTLHYLLILAQTFDIDVSKWRIDFSAIFGSKWGTVKRTCLKVLAWFRGVARRIDETPILVKLQIALLSIILLFIFWQFMAYEMKQTTFICVNIIMAVGLTTATAVISVRSQRGVDEERKISAELKADLALRDKELDKLKSDLFELRNKNRRQNAIEKGSARFVETVKKMKDKAQPDAAPLQYVIDAVDICFDITGAVAFKRDGDEPEVDGGAPEFALAGRFGLSDEPPTKVFAEGDGILGQAVATDKPILLEKVPADYLTALSGLGRSREINVHVLPLTDKEGSVVAVIEVASFEKLKIVDAWEAIEVQLRDVIQS